MLGRISDYIPSFSSLNPLNLRLASPREVVKNLTRIAVPLILLAGLAYQTTKVDAGPVSGLVCYITCMAAGVVATGGGFIPVSTGVCNAVCAGLTLSPIP